MSVVDTQRQLKSLVGDIRGAYRRRLLPPGWLMLVASMLGAAWASTRQDMPLLLALAALAFALSGAITYWPRRRRPGAPGWRSLGLLLALLAALDPDALHGALRWPVLALAGLAVALLALHLIRVRQHATQASQWAATLDDAAILRLLPQAARDDARQWLAGHDHKQAELALVVHLAVLWTVLGAPQPWLPAALQHRLAG